MSHHQPPIITFSAMSKVRLCHSCMCRYFTCICFPFMSSMYSGIYNYYQPAAGRPACMEDREVDVSIESSARLNVRLKSVQMRMHAVYGCTLIVSTL